MKLADGKKIIAVIGSTGAQGGGLVKAILKDPESPFAVRALTRNPDKDTAVALREAGAEVVPFDMDSQPEEMAKALEGVHGLFVVTNFWEHLDGEREMAQAKAVIKAGEIAGVQHYVWSTLENTVPFFDGTSAENQPPKVHGSYVPLFDAKGQANVFFPPEKSTILYTSFYLENFYEFGMINEGVFCANLGDTKLPVIAVDDIGNSTYKIFKAGHPYKGKTVYLAGDTLSADNLMEIASDVMGQQYKYEAVDRETYANFGFPGARDLANMFEYMRLNPAYSKAYNPAHAKALHSDLQSVRLFFETHKTGMLSVGEKK